MWGAGRGHPLTYAQLDGVGVVGPAQQQADEHHRDPVEHPPAPPPHTARARGRHLPAADTCPAPPPPPPAGLAQGRARGTGSPRRDRPGGGGWLCCGHRGRRGASSPSRGGERAEAAAQRWGRGWRTKATRRREAPLRPRLVPARSPPRRLRALGRVQGSRAQTPTAPPEDCRPPVRPCRGLPRGRSKWRPGAHLGPPAPALGPGSRDCKGELTLALGHPPQPQATPRARTRIRGNRLRRVARGRDERSPRNSSQLLSPSSPARPREDCATKSLGAQARTPASCLEIFRSNLWVPVHWLRVAKVRSVSGTDQRNNAV